MRKSNKKLKIKISLVIVLFTLVLMLFGSFLLFRKEIKIYISEADSQCEYLYKFAKESEDVNNFIIKYESIIYQNATKNLAFLLRESAEDGEINLNEFYELSNSANVDNIVIVDKVGNVKKSLSSNSFDFKKSKYDKLLSVFDDDIKSTTLKIFENGVEYYYFSGKINDNLAVIICINFDNVINNSVYLKKWEKILFDNEKNDSFVYFVLSKDSYEILYSNNNEYIGKEVNFSVNSIDKENYSLINIFNKFGFAKLISYDNTDIISFININAIIRKPIIFMLFVVVVFVLCLIFIAMYGFVVSEEADLIREGYSDINESVKYNKIRDKKITIISLTSMVIVLICITIFSSIFAISVADEVTSFYHKEVNNVIQKSNVNNELLNLISKDYYIANNGFINKVLQKHPNMLNTDGLSKISKSLEVDEIRILGIDGKTLCTSNGLDMYCISNDKSDPSYACWDLLSEDGNLILPKTFDNNGNAYECACSTYRDYNNDVCGIIMVKYGIKDKELIEKSLSWRDYLSVELKKYDVFYYMIDTKKGKYIDSSYHNIINQNISDVLIEVDATKNDYQGFISNDECEYFGKTLQANNIIIGIFIELGKLFNYITPDIYFIFVVTILLILLYMLFCISIFKNHIIEREEVDRNYKYNFVLNRVLITDWNSITGSQKISILLTYLFMILVFINSIIFVFGAKIFGEQSIIYYILYGKWHHSLNILAICKSIFLISYILLIAFVANILLKFLSKSFDSRGVTICKLLTNFVKYAAIFVSFYQFFNLVGVDTKTLLASAGILSLIVGFGANKLIQEVVSGLFIIFEGAFQVGDVISVGNTFTGTVKEIGVRNTQIVSVDRNVMIISNSLLGTVINHSTAKTLIIYEYKIDKNIKLDICDEFFNSKTDYLKEKLGDIVKDIKYEGIVGYDKDTYTIRFSISCIEESKAKIEYKIDTEMKVLIEDLSKE